MVRVVVVNAYAVVGVRDGGGGDEKVGCLGKES
jgi:hypothetical protein